MVPGELEEYLLKILDGQIMHAVMIWGKPGIGKSSIINQICKLRDLDFIDLRLSQLMPSDLRGVPVPENGSTTWCPPSFLPKEGKGVLFFDEINMAPPALQGVAQQLILDRRVGDYVLPDGWFVWAAGNKKSDRAAVFEMPAPLANRFIHLQVDTSLSVFKQYAYEKFISPEIIGFLSYRPDLLHKTHPSEPNWPSPRTWEMASNLFKLGLDIEPAVGEGAGIEFNAFIAVRSSLPNIESIFAGKAIEKFPYDPSVRYATITALVAQIQTHEQASHAFKWLAGNADEEWVNLFAADLFPRLRKKKLFQGFSKAIIADAKSRQFLTDYAALVA